MVQTYSNYWTLPPAVSSQITIAMIVGHCTPLIHHRLGLLYAHQTRQLQYLHQNPEQLAHLSLAVQAYVGQAGRETVSFLKANTAPKDRVSSAYNVINASVSTQVVKED
jgi:hypothetical protein